MASLLNEFKNFMISRRCLDVDIKTKEFEKYISGNYTSNAVSDEIVDFLCIKKGLPTRWKSFARYIQTRYDVNEYKNVLDVGSGPIADLSYELIQKGYNVTAIDPRVIQSDDFLCINELFNYEVTNVSNYDLIVGLEPCDATEHILRSALLNNKAFAISLCYNAHNSLDGKKFKTPEAWYKYLIDSSNGKAYIDDKKILNINHKILRNK